MRSLLASAGAPVIEGDAIMTEQPQDQPAVPQTSPQSAYGAVGSSPSGPPGKPRNIGVCILLEIVTIGIYGLFWVYWTQKEIKDHSGQGLGGGLGLVIYIFVAPVTFFLVPNDIEKMLQQAGRTSRVSLVTGFWVLLPLVGPIVWFVKVQGQLNDYWQSLGATA
jgi:hypothetical protein